MNAKDFLYNEIIAKDERLKTIKLNTKTNKIEMEGYPFLGITYTEIYDLATEKFPDTKFTKTLVKDVVAKWAYDHKYKPSEPELADWYKQIDRNEKGVPEKTLNNLINFFKYYPEYVDKFTYNEFTQYANYENQMLEEHMITEFRKVVEKQLGFEAKEKVTAAVEYNCFQNSFNPFKDAIENLVWDGEERAETLFIKFIGAEDTPLNRIMTKKWLFAMIKRLYEPGCDFDNMLIVYDSTQGTGKTKIVKRLVECLGVGYGYDTTITYDNLNKDNIDKLNKTWVVAIDELTNFLKVEPEKAKQFICANSDTARLSYDRRSKLFQRHCVFYGSTNVELFLKDYSSDYERRYWIMDCNGQPHSSDWWEENLPDEYLQQVIAEMYYLYTHNEAGFDYKTLTIEETEALKEVQKRHKTINNDDILIESLDDMLNYKYYEANTFNSYSDFCSKIFRGRTEDELKISVPDFIAFEQEEWVMLDKIPVTYIKQWVKDQLKRDVNSTQYLSAVMNIIGWKYKKVRINGKVINSYIKC